MPTVSHRMCRGPRRPFFTPKPLLTPLMIAALGVAGAARADDGASASAELLKRIERLERVATAGTLAQQATDRNLMRVIRTGMPVRNLDNEVLEVAT